MDDDDGLLYLINNVRGGVLMSSYCYECMKEIPDDIRVCIHCNAKVPYISTNSRDCPAGTILNKKYLLGKAIGRGGFGVTYIALDIKTHEKVCIKECNLKDRCMRDPSNPTMLLPINEEEAARDFDRYKRGFQDERKRLMQLRDIPQVVQCYEGFACNNTVYMVQEFLEGRDLKNYVKRERGSRNPLSIGESVFYTTQILDILSQVHKRKILHRDISPDNIFMLRDGTLKLIDFGSARQMSRGEMTSFNKPGYTPPEMLLGDKEGPYSDVYSVGAVLYFMLVGEKPEPVEGTGGLQPPPRSKSYPELTEIFLRAVQRNVEWRYQTAEEMAEDLRYIAGIVVAKKRQSRLPQLAVVFLSLLLIALIIIAFSAGDGSDRADTAPSPNPTWSFIHSEMPREE